MHKCCMAITFDSIDLADGPPLICMQRRTPSWHMNIRLHDAYNHWWLARLPIVSADLINSLIAAFQPLDIGDQLQDA